MEQTARRYRGIGAGKIATERAGEVQKRVQGVAGDVVLSGVPPNTSPSFRRKVLVHIQSPGASELSGRTASEPEAGIALPLLQPGSE